MGAPADKRAWNSPKLQAQPSERGPIDTYISKLTYAPRLKDSLTVAP